MGDNDNLTLLEVAAVSDEDGGLNLTDGHARLGLTPEHEAIVARIPDMFRSASSRGFADIERAAHAAFYAAIGQHTAPVGSGRIYSCYSSTLATDIVARALPVGARCAVLHPTFDNIADLLVTRGLRLQPMEEADVVAARWPGPPVDIVVVTHPNNPTGLVIDEERMRSLAEHVARHGQVLIVDASFRGQVREAQYDTYAVLDAAGADWVVIEDSGKLWPMHELKVGLLAHAEHSSLPIRRAFSESLLTASPVVLQLVESLAADWANGGYERSRRLIDDNRAIVREAIAGSALRLADPHSQISVARIFLPPDGPDSNVLHAELLRRGVHVLPCAPFHWAEPEEGLRFIRISLGRPSDVVSAAAVALADAYAALSTTAA